MTRVVYSIGAKFAGGGIGTTAYHAVRGLYKHGYLHNLLCGSYQSSDIPKNYIHTMGLPSKALRKLSAIFDSRTLSLIHNIIYDRWASNNLAEAELFLGWGNFSLYSIQIAQKMGILTLVQRASTHSRYQANLLAEEYSRWGLNYHRSEIAIRRSEKEFEIADYILIPSDFVRKSFIDQGISEVKLVQIPFGVDINRFKPESNRNNRFKFRVLFAGQISIRKGVGYLLEAWKELNWEDAELCLVGRVTKDFRKILKQYISLPGLKLMGHVHNPVKVFQSSDIFAFPTIEEGSALVTYEALACGLPVITTPNAGSIVRNGEDGFLIPIRDVGYLVEKMKVLRQDYQLRKKMSLNARQRASNFTWDKHGDDLSERLGSLVLKNKQQR